MTLTFALATSLVIPFPDCDPTPDPGCGLGCEYDYDIFVEATCWAMPDTSCCYTRTYYVHCKPTRPPLPGDPPVYCADYFNTITAKNEFATCCEGYSDPTLRCRPYDECSSGG